MQASRDENRVTTLLAVSNVDGITPVSLWADPVTHRLLVDIPGSGGGTVTSVSVVTANGLSGTVANPTTTPAITLDITALDATKIANGTVSNTEFQYLDGVTSAIQTQINAKQATLVSGTNIKTINSTSLLGSGDIAITATPAGSDTEIQFNNSGALGASANLTFNGTDLVIGTTTNQVTVTDASIRGTGSGAPQTPYISLKSTSNNLTIGYATAAGATATGGGIYIFANNGGATSGAGGDFFMGAGNAVGGNSNGGSFYFYAGSKTGAGTNGILQYATDSGQYTFLSNLAGDGTAILNAASITTSKTFTLPDLTGTFALTTNNLSVFAATTSSQLAGVISDETGSGALVFATSPTLVTPVLGAATGTSLQLSGLTASEIVITDASKNLVSAAVATYPSLTELTYVKGVTSAIQTQINTKAPSASPTFTGTVVLPATTAGGVITLSENSAIALDPAGSADGKYTGITVTATAGYTQSFGDLVYLDPTDNRWELADANSASGADGDARGMLAMVVVAGTDGNPCTLLLQGIIRADAKFPTFTVNNPIYVSETAGSVTQTQPTTTDVVIRILGSALTADEMYFNPDNMWITHT